ncbi:MAG TPA: hypothetical protein VIO64_10435 [Pseudobacteroides sp.]|uniref:hypothetical protein n=1 Tax=Pseudobacteroides sp. TaxID=1968840 RepID=UPI002F95A534
MSNYKNTNNYGEFENTVKQYIKEGRMKLQNDLIQTSHAIHSIAQNKTKCFIKNMDKGLDKEEREYLTSLILTSMHQAFCYGYGIGKIESDNFYGLLFST